MEGKKTLGRQKIEIKLIEDRDGRLVAFSKRRGGIYKKVCELATLCGAEICFVVFSQTGKPFSFGHPSVESVIRKFLKQKEPEGDQKAHFVNAQRQARINDLIQRHNAIEMELDAEKDQGNMLKRTKKGKGNEHEWWNSPIEKLTVQELKQLNASIDELYSKLYAKLIERSTCGSSSFPPPMN